MQRLPWVCQRPSAPALARTRPAVVPRSDARAWVDWVVEDLDAERGVGFPLRASICMFQVFGGLKPTQFVVRRVSRGPLEDAGRRLRRHHHDVHLGHASFAHDALLQHAQRRSHNHSSRRFFSSPFYRCQFAFCCGCRSATCGEGGIAIISRDHDEFCRRS